MSVLLNKDKTELIVTCKCGCGDSMHIKIDKEDRDCYAISTLMSSNWYRDQDETVFRVVCKKIAKIWSIIINKDYYYSDIVMTKNDFLEFKEYVNNIEM